MDPRPDLSHLVAGRTPDISEARDLRAWAHPHGLSGLLAREIERGRIVPPAQDTEAVLADWNAERRWSAVLDLELGRISRAPTGLPSPILLKGPAVAGRYADPAVRNYVDIDLLVPRDSFEAWTRRLESLGFRHPVRTPWNRRRARYQHHLVLRRPVGGRDMLCELHRRLFVERSALRVTYEVLCAYAQSSPFDGVLFLNDAAQLVVLALHLAHHRPEARRLIWYRDIIEIGSEDVVSDARALASHFGVTWAVEQALFETELLLGEPVWAASPPRRRRFGTALLAETEGSDHLMAFALARELGLRDWLGYVGTMLDPRRFTRPDGGFDRDAFRNWVKTTARGVRAIPLRALLNRRSDR